MDDKKPKIYRMNDFDTVIAYSKKEAVNWYFKEWNSTDSKEEIAIECEQERKLSKTFWWNCRNPEELWDRAMKLNQGEEIKVSTWASDPAYLVSFQYVIENLLERLDIPGLICTTEY